MGGRDAGAEGRVATPLELLFDLTFAVAFGVAGQQFAHLIAAGHMASGMAGFGFAAFGITWAWINFSWFASAYDTDDWFFRLTTMLQMVGVVVFALGLPTMFHSLDHAHLDNRVMVLGYIVMRVAMLTQWLRVARQDPQRRGVAMTYVTAIAVAQVGWTLLAFLNTSLVIAAIGSLVLAVVELQGPLIAERCMGGTPWHAHHIAERYGLLVIITLGEGIIGTVATLSAAVEEHGWDLTAVLVVIAGVGLTFGMWWAYFALDMAHALERRRTRSFGFGYGHIPIFAAIAATGAGLHVAALVIEGQATIDTLAAVTAVAAPVGVFIVLIYAMYWYLIGNHDGVHNALLVGTAVVIALALVLAGTGVSMGWCLIVVMLAPAVSVVGYEIVGHRHQAAALAGEE